MVDSVSLYSAFSSSSFAFASSVFSFVAPYSALSASTAASCLAISLDSFSEVPVSFSSASSASPIEPTKTAIPAVRAANAAVTINIAGPFIAALNISVAFPASNVAAVYAPIATVNAPSATAIPSMAPTTAGCSLTNSDSLLIISVPFCISPSRLGWAFPIAIFKFSSEFSHFCFTNSPVSDIFSNAVCAAPALFPICAIASSTFCAFPHNTFAAFPASALPNILEMLVPLSRALSSNTASTSVRLIPLSIASAIVRPPSLICSVPSFNALAADVPFLPNSFSILFIYVVVSAVAIPFAVITA